jgi:hypothetical protein
MKLPQEVIDQLFGNENLATELAKLTKTLNGLASLALISGAIYLPYQAILTILSWF